MKFINTIVRIKMFVDLFSIQTTNDDDKLCISQQMNEKRLTNKIKQTKSIYIFLNKTRLLSLLEHKRKVEVTSALFLAATLAAAVLKAQV